MKEIHNHRIGEIVYHRGSNLYLVISGVDNVVDGYVYHLKYVPKSEHKYNPLRSRYAGMYSDDAFENIFETCLNI